MTSPNRFLKACRLQPVDVTPVWLMRQAGRYMPEYRALRKQHKLLELMKNPELAAEVTLQPLQAFDLDAAIIFADILTLPEAMGLELDFVEGKGPILRNPIRTAYDVDRLQPIDPADALHFTLEAIRLVVAQLNGRLPLIGFSGAPFTLACYAIEGGSSRSFAKTEQFMREQPDAWHALLGKLADAVGRYLAAQAHAGAQALQLFDSWVGLLNIDDYVSHALPYTQRALAIAREATDTPLIHFGTKTAGLLSHIRASGASVIGVDWRITLDCAWEIIGHDIAIQGNLDPSTLLSDIPTIQEQAVRILQQAGGRPGHIFNLGHGVLPDTPTEHVQALIECVHAYAPTAP